MKRNQLGQSDLYVSEIGLGCMSLGTDVKKATGLIHEALERGINFLDTADIYDDGLNEEILGQALQGRRSDVILATKVGNRREAGKPGWSWDPSKDYIKNAVKDSLKRLNTDYIDLYQLHGGTMEDPIDETIEAFEELKQEGVIREYGISSIRPNVIAQFVERSNIVSVMSQYSILDRRPEEAVLPLLADKGISMIARGPVAKGLLSKDGHKKVEIGMLDYSKDELLTILNRLQQMSSSVARGDITHTAIRYVLAHKAVATAIPGASSLEQLLHNIQASEASPLSQSEIDLIHQISHANQYDQHRF